ncbi:MAG: crotonase/enoyl-CoA hydratase family protein [Acidimicrobiales bacterium]
MAKILVENDGPVRTIILNRPTARNALDLEGSAMLHQAFRDFENDEQASVAVVCGAGSAFCAGADLNEMAEKGAVYSPWAGTDGLLARPLSKPLLAAVEGHAVAGGLGIALYCDMRIASETAVFGYFCRRFGVPGSDGSTVRLPRLIGIGRALDMLNTGRAVDAHEAKAIGLADRVEPEGQARSAAERLARTMAELPQAALLADRWSALGQQGMSLADALNAEAQGAEHAKRSGAQAGAARFADGAGRGGEANRS